MKRGNLVIWPGEKRNSRSTVAGWEMSETECYTLTRFVFFLAQVVLWNVQTRVILLLLIRRCFALHAAQSRSSASPDEIFSELARIVVDWFYCMVFLARKLIISTDVNFFVFFVLRLTASRLSSDGRVYSIVFKYVCFFHVDKPFRRTWPVQ